MPLPEKEFWHGHFKVGTVQFKKRNLEEPAAVIFLVELDHPERFKGRIVEVRMTHEIGVAALINDLIQALREKGKHLPNRMG